MKTSTLAATLSLMLSITGCGTVFSARASVSSQGASAQVGADGRAVDAAAAVAGLAARLATSGSTDSQTRVAAGVHGPTVDGAASSGGQTTASGGEGRVGVARATPGSRSAGDGASRGALATIQMGRVGAVTIERMTAVGGDDDVIAGGSISLDGAPIVDGGLVVVDGAIELAGRAAGQTRGRAPVQREGSARWRVDRGVIVVADQDGHRWRLRVQGGDLAVRTEGYNPEGRAVWVPTQGALQVEVTAMGDGRLGLTGDAPAVPVASRANVVLSTETLGALDELLRSAPPGSDDALRLASAVQVTLRESEQSEPAFYNVPIRGRSIVLVVDVSYSMREPDPSAVDLSIAPGHTPTKLDVARAELVKVLGSLPHDVAVNVVAFSSNVTRLWQNPRVLDRAALSEAIRWIGALRPRDETEPVAALEAAAAMQPEQIVLLSDGRPTDRDLIARALLGLAEGVSTRMRLDVVGIGPDQDRTFLAALAARGRGEFRLR